LKVLHEKKIDSRIKELDWNVETEEVKYTREELIKIFRWADDILRTEGIQKEIVNDMKNKDKEILEYHIKAENLEKEKYNVLSKL